MKTRIISITVPLIEGINTAEELIVHNARVSNPNNQLNTETGAKLLAYCMKHGHWSVFEQADMTVEIKTSRAISAQLLRHKSFFFQEFSQRYAIAPNVEQIELRKQADKNRQSSSELICDGELQWSVNKAVIACQSVYEQLIHAGVAKECARMVLPLATSTTLYMKGSIRSWIHYFMVRCSDNTQKEHRLIANEIKDSFAYHFPVIAEAIELQA